MAGIKIKIDDYLTKKLWGTDLDSLGTPGACWIKFLRFLYLLFLEVSEEQLALRAMGLVYITLLSLVPLLAVSFSVLKAFGVHTRFEIFLYYFLEPLGDKGVDLSLKIIGFVENVNAGVLGSIGLAMLVYTVMSQIRRLESALNYIWHVKSTRSFEKRFSNYLSVLLVGPVLIFSAVGITGSLMSTAVVQKILAIKSLGSILYYTGRLIPYILVSSAFTFIYIFLPNTKVRFTSALTGGLFSGVMWKLTGMVFTSFIVSSAEYSAIYSGFSILILSLIWLYWSWFIFLVGSRVSYYQQYPMLVYAGRGPLSLSSKMKEKLALVIMYLIGDNYHRNERRWRLEPLSRYLGLPAFVIQETLTILEKNGLLISSAEEPSSYLPAKDLEMITVAEILEAVRISGEEAFSGIKLIAIPEVDSLISQADDALCQSFKNKTLKSLLASGGNLSIADPDKGT